MAITGEISESKYSLVDTRQAFDDHKKGSMRKLDSLKCSAYVILNLLPGILTTIASIVSFIFMNVLQHHYFSITCAIGTITGAGTIYQAYHARLLKAFQTNNKILNSRIMILHLENQSLKDSVNNFSSENKNLSLSVCLLKETYSDLEKEKFNLLESNRSLKVSVTDLESVNKLLEDKVNVHMERLEALKNSLNGIQHATEKDHTQFAKYVESFVAEVKKLQETNEQLVTTGTSFEKTMITLLQTAQMLQDIFTKINQWKDDKYIEHLIQMQQTLSKQVLELEKKISREEGIEEAKRQNLCKFVDIKEQFERALYMIDEKTKSVETTAGKLQLTVKKYATINQNIEAANISNQLSDLTAPSAKEN